MPLHIRPITLALAKSFVGKTHRHNKPPTGHKLSVGLFDGYILCGVGVLSRPIARMLDTGLNAEITRTSTDGTSNANSQIYGALLRCAKSMGYHKVYTYTQAGESGASLRAVGFVRDAELPARKNWAESTGPNSAIRRDIDATTGGVARTRWVVVYASNAP